MKKWNDFTGLRISMRSGGSLKRTFQLLEQETQTDSGNIHQEVEEVKHYINTHYGEEISIEMLAERVFFGPQLSEYDF